MRVHVRVRLSNTPRNSVAPSSGHTNGILTTDLLGSPGTSSNDCTERFGGTSVRDCIATRLDIRIEREMCVCVCVCVCVCM